MTGNFHQLLSLLCSGHRQYPLLQSRSDCSILEGESEERVLLRQTYEYKRQAEGFRVPAPVLKSPLIQNIVSSHFYGGPRSAAFLSLDCCG